MGSKELRKVAGQKEDVICASERKSAPCHHVPRRSWVTHRLRPSPCSQGVPPNRPSGMWVRGRTSSGASPPCSQGPIPSAPAPSAFALRSPSSHFLLGLTFLNMRGDCAEWPSAHLLFLLPLKRAFLVTKNSAPLSLCPQLCGYSAYC